MDYSDKFLANRPIETALLSYGFRSEGDFLIYEKKNHH